MADLLGHRTTIFQHPAHGTPMQNQNILAIKDQNVRAVARGLLDRNTSALEKSSSIKRMLNTISRSDLITLDHLIRNNTLFRHIDLLPELSFDSPFTSLKGVTLFPINNLAIEYLSHRISLQEEIICNVFESFSRINEAISKRDDAAIALEITNSVSIYGHSLAVARKAAFVLAYAPRDSLAYRTCYDLVQIYGINSNNYGAIAVLDTIGPEFNYLDLREGFKDYASMHESAGRARRLAFLSFNPLAKDAAQIPEILRAYYEIGVVDATIAYLAHADDQMLEPNLPSNLMRSWRSLSQSSGGVIYYLQEEDPFADLWAFRAAPAFLESLPLRNLRRAMEGLYVLPSSAIHPGQNEHESTFFAEASEIRGLIAEDDHPFEALPATFKSETAGFLTRTCALVRACRNEPDFSQISAEEMAALMGQTFEVDRLLSTDQLRSASASAKDPFVRLILQTLLRAQSSATKDNYAFKQLLQEYVRGFHEGEMIGFLKKVHALNKNVVHYFVNLLDETMLSQMPFLISSSEAIFETRAQMLEWFAEIEGDDLAASKARQLRLDRKIAAARGMINETRLNIDAVRFRQWVEQRKLPDFSDFVRQSSPNLPQLSELVDRSKNSTQFLAAHREPATKALQAFAACYDEFCRNPDFGIASFLGRRIRHGTLRGTLLNGRPEPSEVDLPPAITSQYTSWCADFSSSIDALTGRLYFRTKTTHKDGFLSSEIDSEQKWQIALVSLTRIFDDSQRDHGIQNISILIEQACWLIFELELAKVRTSIGEARARWGSLKVKHSGSDNQVAAFERDVNVSVGDQFTTVTSWFRKPPNISPIAEIRHVISVVIQEANDEYVGFAPAIEFRGDTELQLSGATYYVVYDALTIAVRNAAKHGAHPGTVTIDANVRDFNDAKLLEVSVSSFLKEGDDVASALERIREAGEQGAIGADVVEGLSGIRKLKKMEIERSIMSFRPDQVPGLPNQIAISFVIPFKGVVQ